MTVLGGTLRFDIRRPQAVRPITGSRPHPRRSPYAVPWGCSRLLGATRRSRVLRAPPTACGNRRHPDDSVAHRSIADDHRCRCRRRRGHHRGRARCIFGRRSKHERGVGPAAATAGVAGSTAGDNGEYRGYCGRRRGCRRGRRGCSHAKLADPNAPPLPTPTPSPTPTPVPTPTPTQPGSAVLTGATRATAAPSPAHTLAAPSPAEPCCRAHGDAAAEVAAVRGAPRMA